MHGSIRSRCRRLAPALGGALALAVVPCQIVLHGCVPAIGEASAHAAKGGNGGGNNGNGGGNGGNGGGNNGNTGKGQGDKGEGDKGDKGASHVDTTTGDKVETEGGKITVHHPDGMTEEIDNGRFRMLDALGRTIIDRRATPADVSRLKAL